MGQIGRDEVPCVRSQVNHLSLANGELIRLKCNVAWVVTIVSFNKALGRLERESGVQDLSILRTKVPRMSRAWLPASEVLLRQSLAEREHWPARTCLLRSEDEAIFLM